MNKGRPERIKVRPFLHALYRGKMVPFSAIIDLPWQTLQMANFSGKWPPEALKNLSSDAPAKSSTAWFLAFA